MWAVGYLFDELRKNREDEADADSIEADSGKNDEKGSVHGGSMIVSIVSRSPGCIQDIVEPQIETW